MNGFVFNGSHCSTNNVIMLSVDRSILPASNNVYLQVPNRDGSYLFDRELSDRIIKVSCTVFANSTIDLALIARQISGWIFTKQRVPLIFDDEPDKYYMAKYDGAIGLSQIATDGEFSLTFRCEPYAYSLVNKQQSFVNSAIEVANVGTAPMYPKITSTFIASASEYNLWFEGCNMRLVRSFVAGDVVVIDNAISKVTVNGVNAMLNLDLSSRFFGIGSGVHALNTTPVSVANTTIIWKERWL